MLVLITGLLLFLGTHSIRIVADDWRGRQVARLGEKPWKGIFTLLSAVGLGLTVWGFRLAGAEPQALWHPPRWASHTAALLTIPAFILLVAAYVPGSRIKGLVGHPMVLGVALWALAHLLANGRDRDVVLFGAFFVWAAVDFFSARHRQPPTRSGTIGRDALVAVIGLVAWAAFATFLHGWLFGVRPFG